MGTLHWTSTYERGFEGLQPDVSPSYRRRSLTVVCCGCLCWGGLFRVFVVFVMFLDEIFLFWPQLGNGNTLSSLMFCHITTVTAVMARAATDQKKSPSGNLYIGSMPGNFAQLAFPTNDRFSCQAASHFAIALHILSTSGHKGRVGEEFRNEQKMLVLLMSQWSLASCTLFFQDQSSARGAIVNATYRCVAVLPWRILRLDVLSLLPIVGTKAVSLSLWGTLTSFHRSSHLDKGVNSRFMQHRHRSWSAHVLGQPSEVWFMDACQRVWTEWLIHIWAPHGWGCHVMQAPSERRLRSNCCSMVHPLWTWRFSGGIGMAASGDRDTNA